MDSDGVHLSGQGKWGYCSDDCYGPVPTGVFLEPLISIFTKIITLFERTLGTIQSVS